MIRMSTIVIATRNRGKAHEYKKMFRSKGIQIKTWLDFPGHLQVKETGHSFEENATLKAKSAVKWLKMPALADDSGLEVRAINNEPGIYSARYAGDHNNIANQRKLLRKLRNINNREAQFVTCLVLLKPNGKKLVAYGRLKGQILRSPRGHNGFGYDPLFYVPKYHKTLAQMTTDQKDRISHRGMATRKMMTSFDDWWNHN